MSNVTLRRSKPEDHMTMARIEIAAFADDEFDNVLYGPRRFDQDILQEWAEGMGSSDKQGEIYKDVLAVTDDGEVIAFASWCTVNVEDGGVGIYGVGKEKNDDDKKKKNGVKSKIEQIRDQKLYEDAFIVADQDMAKACKGGSYHKLFTLVVLPEHQKKGVGSLLLEDGLKEADQKNLQCVLGASPQGLGLYLKHGFQVVAEHSLKLWEYERGEGKEAAGHSIMHRPAKSTAQDFRRNR